MQTLQALSAGVAAAWLSAACDPQTQYADTRRLGPDTNEQPAGARTPSDPVLREPQGSGGRDAPAGGASGTSGAATTDTGTASGARAAIEDTGGNATGISDVGNAEGAGDGGSGGRDASIGNETTIPRHDVDAPAAGPCEPPVTSDRVRFAVIGDYGWASPEERAVADLIRSWSPDLILTTGDNNYPIGAAETIDENIGQFFSEFICPYVGRYGDGGRVNRFFPSLGNHDWYTPGAIPYLEYFTLPGNERYYDFRWGSVHFFAVDSDWSEPDGVDRESRQAAWLESRLKASKARWQVVYMHHPPYSSGSHGSSLELRWDYQAWGADLVIAGHDHTYERLDIDGLTYIVNGLGGRPTYFFRPAIEGSLVRLTNAHGALRVDADETQLQIRFFGTEGAAWDGLTLR